MKKFITLINPYCEYNCLHCCYDTNVRIPHRMVKDTIIGLQEKGYFVHLYELSPDDNSIELFELTRQFEQRGEHGFNWLNITDRFPLTKRNIDFLRKVHATIHYSIFGSTNERNTLITGDPESFNRTIDHFKKARELLPDNELSFFLVLHKNNVDDLPNIIRLCEKLDADELDITFLAYISRARNKRLKDIYLDKEDIKKFLSIFNYLQDKTNIHISIDMTCGPIFTKKLTINRCNIWAPGIKGFYCGQAKNQYTIMLGSNLVFPCASMAGDDNLSIGKFEDGEIIINKDWPLDFRNIKEPCKTCEKFQYCKGGCRADSIFEELRITGRYNFNAGQIRCLHNNSKQYGKRSHGIIS